MKQFYFSLWQAIFKRKPLADFMFGDKLISVRTHKNSWQTISCNGRILLQGYTNLVSKKLKKFEEKELDLLATVS